MSDTTQPRFLAFLDILGFKDLIENNPIEYLEKLYDKFEPALLYSMAVTNLSYRREHLDSPDLPSLEETHLNSIVISDSIIIWTDDDDTNSFVDIVSAVRYYLFLAIELGLPLRGAITMGPVAVKSGKHVRSRKFNSYTTILGKTLTKAYLLENKLNCVGCLVDDECIEHFQNNSSSDTIDEGSTPLTIKSLEEFGFLKKYLAPMRNSVVSEKYLINWTFYFGPRLTEEKIRRSFSMHNKQTNTWEVEEKIRNTIQFLKDTDDDFKAFEQMMKSEDGA